LKESGQRPDKKARSHAPAWERTVLLLRFGSSYPPPLQTGKSWIHHYTDTYKGRGTNFRIAVLHPETLN